MEIETTVTVKGVLVAVTVTGEYEPGSADCYYQRNGDPGDQGDPDYFAIETALTAEGVDLYPSLSDSELETLIEACCQAAEAEQAEAEASMDAWMAEQAEAEED